MTLKGPEFKKALLLGFVTAAVPLFYYPYDFGWSGSVAGSPRYVFLEWAYYVLAFRYLFPREPFSHHLKASATGFAFRLFMGFTWAILVGAFRNMGIGDALVPGLYGYLPGVLLQVLVTPWLLRPVFRFRDLRRRVPVERAADFATSPRPGPQTRPDTAPVAPASGESTPNFGAAVDHIASYSTVQLAILVDEEGLSVARASRGASDYELWAPVINLVYGAVQRELQRTPDADVRRFEVTLRSSRLVVERVAPFYLAVLVDQAADELVNVRIAQAVDMVKKHFHQRYPNEAPAALTEVAYV